MRICGGEGGEKFLSAGGMWMGFSDSIDIDNCVSVLGAEGKSGGLDATITVGSLVGAVERHDGGGVKKCDRFGCKHCHVAMFAEKSIECRVSGVSSVDEVCVRLLDGEDVKILCDGKVDCTGGGVMEALVPCGCAKDGGLSGRRGGESVIGSG